MQQSQPFRPSSLHPREGNPLKHSLRKSKKNSPMSFCRRAGRTTTPPPPPPQRTPKRGAKQRGGGKTSRGEPPTENSFRPPPSPRYVPPPPNATSPTKSLTNFQNFPRATPSKTVFGGSPKWFPTGHPCEVLPPPPLFCPPPPFGSAQPAPSSLRSFVEASRAATQQNVVLRGCRCGTLGHSCEAAGTCRIAHSIRWPRPSFFSMHAMQRIGEG